MFNFENNHKIKARLDSDSSRGNALKYLNKLTDAFEVLEEVESLLSGVLLEKKCSTDCVAQTSSIKGKDFCIKLLFSHDSESPLAAEIVKECSDE